MREELEDGDFDTDGYYISKKVNICFNFNQIGQFFIR